VWRELCAPSQSRDLAIAAGVRARGVDELEWSEVRSSEGAYEWW
jgi:hypothetical protein